MAQRPLEGDRLAAKARGELCGALHVPVRDIDEGDAVRDEMLRRELRHLACAENQRVASLEAAELLARELDGGVAHRHRVVLDARLRTHALARLDRAVHERVEHGARRARLARERVGLLDLREDLPLAEHERVEARGDAEQMADAVLVHVGIEIRVDVFLVAREVEKELLERREVVRRRLDDGVDLAAVAGREHDGLVHAVVVAEVREPLPHGALGDCELLAHRDGRRLMIQSETNELHV